MTETGKKINGAANLVMLVAAIAASIVGVIAFIQAAWLWWHAALGICAIVGAWGVVLALVASLIRD